MFFEILTFYDQYKRTFPWRGETPNPYHVYVSEIMLQQTTTTTVVDYFNRFIRRFPTIEDLAKADVNDVLLLWQGLGYYSRGRNLHKAAKALVQLTCHSSQGDSIVQIPNAYPSLIVLPGIGDYTAKAILAIAYNQDVLPIDGNIKRVLARYFGLDVPYEQLHKTIESMSFNFHGRPGDLCQGLMDFANTICLARNPKCTACPFQNSCQAYQQGMVNDLPRPKHKIEKKLMVREGLICVKDDCIALNYHQPGTLLGGLWNVPMVDQGHFLEGVIPAKALTCSEAINPIAEGDRKKMGSRLHGNNTGIHIRHIFTHIDLRLTLHYVDDLACDAFVSFDELSQYPLSRLTTKILQAIR